MPTAINEHPTPETVLPREFRMPPMFRRVPIYLFLGSVAVLMISRHFKGPNFDWSRVTPILVFFMGGAIGLALVQESWRLRIDSHGISRHRFLLGWDHFAWDDFKNGAIRPTQFTGKYIDPTRPWGRRTFSLQYLALHNADDSEYVYSLIKGLLPPAAPVELPDTLSIRPRLTLGLTCWKLTANGVTFQNLRNWQVYDWDSVQAVELLRSNHDRDDFDSLRIVFYNRCLRLNISVQHDRMPSWWSAATPTQIAAMVLRHAPADRVTITARYGRSLNVEEAQRRVGKARTISCNVSWACWVAGIIEFASLLALLLGIKMEASSHFIGNAFIVAGYTFHFLIVFLAWRVKCRRELRELEQMLTDLLCSN